MWWFLPFSCFCCSGFVCSWLCVQLIQCYSLITCLLFCSLILPVLWFCLFSSSVCRILCRIFCKWWLGGHVLFYFHFMPILLLMCLLRNLLLFWWVSFYVLFFLSAAFNILSLFSVLVILMIMCHGEVLSSSGLFGILEAFYTWMGNILLNMLHIPLVYHLFSFFNAHRFSGLVFWWSCWVLAYPFTTVKLFD
jgi:hypothetical protein